MRHLISMADFVLEQERLIPLIPNLPKVIDMDRTFVQRIILYARFLKMPLELWMFIPCDEDGNVLEYPIEPEYPYNDKTCDIWSQYDIYLKKYQQAKERCLFEGFKYKDGYLINGMNCINLKLHETIEDLAKYNLQLTKTAIKQLGL